MGLTSEQLRRAIDAVASEHRPIADALARIGYPEPRVQERGYVTLLRTIVGQQVSFRAAASVWAKLEAATGGIATPEALLKLDIDALRQAGLSRQKASYAVSLAEQVASGALDLSQLPADDEEAIAALCRVRGIGRWSAEIYLLFAEGRPDIWPAGDLAVQIEMGRIMELPSRPSEGVTRALAEPWRPHRGAMAVFMWHHYRTEVI